MKLKNEIVFRVTGQVLIPTEQIVLEPYFRLKASEYLVQDNCPYCVPRFAINIGCKDCPMELADNGCMRKTNCGIAFSTDSTWYVANIMWQEMASLDDRRELYDLTVRYNKENGNN